MAIEPVDKRFDPGGGRRTEAVGEAGAPLLDLAPIHEPILDEMEEAVLRVLRSNRFIGGPEVEGFEAEFSAYTGSAHAVGVSSGTDALLVSMMAVGVGAGDEVVVPAFTFFSTAGSVQRLGATPVFCDIDPITFNMNPRRLAELVSERTKAVIPVHLFGQCADMDAIDTVCRPRGIPVIEDAAQSVGADYYGRQSGSMGDFGCFSFFPSKNLGGIGDGGMVSTNDPDRAARVRSLRNHGEERRYHHSVVGGNFRLDAIQAAALRVKLRYLEQWQEMRRTNAAAYKEAFADAESMGLVTAPAECEGRKHVYNQFVIRTRDRDGLHERLIERKIGCAIYYPAPLHLQACFSGLGVREGALPESERAAKEVIALPVFPGLGERRRNAVVDTVMEFLLERN